MNISSIQSNIHRYKREINYLDAKIADKQKRCIEAKTKMDRAITATQKATSLSIMRLKNAESLKYSKEANKYANEITVLQKKRVAKTKSLLIEEQKLLKAQKDEAKKSVIKQKKIANDNELKMIKSIQTVAKVQMAQDRLPQLYPLLTISSEDAYDVFISHASEDKADFVDGLVEELLKRNVNVWYDRDILTWGKSIRQSIDQGLKRSKYAIIVLSEHYVKKYWTQKEFNALFNLSSRLSEFILPIWHNISEETVNDFSPMLSDTKALKSSDYTLSEIAEFFVKKLTINNG